jgi:hypothetical protein
MAMNKKAMFFTISTILLVSLLLATMSIPIKNTSAKKRITTMNNLIQDIETDITRASSIIGKRAIISLTNEIINNFEYSENVEEDIKELMLYSTLNNITSSHMEDTNINNWIEKMQQNANKINLDLDMEIIEIETRQSNPWNIDLSISYHLTLKDKNNIAEFNYEDNIKTKVSIIGLEDPIYSMNTNGKISNIIVESLYSDFTENNNTDNLIDHTINQHYISSTLAPSYLDRLEGKADANINGIESLINIQNLIDNKVNIKSKTIVDYLYFSSTSTTDYRIIGTPNWFRIDESHLNTYDCEDLTE